MSNTPSVKAKITRIIDKESSKVKAVASLVIGGSFAVHGLKVVGGSNGDFVALPSTKSPDGKYSDIFHAVTAEARTQMMDAVLLAYEAKLAEQQSQSEDSELSEAPGMNMQ